MNANNSLKRQERQDAKSAKKCNNNFSVLSWRSWRLGALGAKSLFNSFTHNAASTARAFCFCTTILLFFSIVIAAQPLTISAAISIKDALSAASAEYQKQYNQPVRLNFGASGDLANQIEAGAPADLFISAGVEQITQLTRAKMIDGDPTIVARNELVLIVPTDHPAISSWNNLKSINHLCIGNPKSVPAGHYAMQVLDYLKLSQPLNGKLIYAANVRQVLAYVERGEVDAGIVYSTDAKQAGERIRIAAVAPAASHEPIQYPAAIIHGQNAAEARKFLRFLTTPEGQAILARYGFHRGLP